jgi:hypothetical protein
VKELKTKRVGKTRKRIKWTLGLGPIMQYIHACVSQACLGTESRSTCWLWWGMDNSRTEIIDRMAENHSNYFRILHCCISITYKAKT